jgi:surfactin synthase thioesterase subunit
MTDLLEEATQPERNIPYAFYGHSVGALIAYHLAYRLWQNKDPYLIHFFAGGFTSPVIPNPVLYTTIAEFTAAGFNGLPSPDQVTDSNLNHILDILSAPNYEHLMPRKPEFARRSLATFKMIESYFETRQPNEPFNIPITALHGQDDDLVGRKDTEAWHPLTTAPFKHHTLPGDHLFMNEDQSQKQLLELIIETLTPHTP